MAQSIHFSSKEKNYLGEALEIAEALAGRYYSIAASDWKKYPYDIRTLQHLNSEEVTDKGFAQLAKYSVNKCPKRRETRINDFYRICVQDHVILNAINRDKEISLKPLLLYTITHELIHIVRFSHLLRDYFMSEKRRNWEEREVHGITYQLLRGFQYEGLGEVIYAYEWARDAVPQ